MKKTGNFIYFVFGSMLLAIVLLVFQALSQLPKQKYVLEKKFMEECHQSTNKKLLFIQKRVRKLLALSFKQVNITNRLSFKKAEMEDDLVQAFFLIQPKKGILIPENVKHSYNDDFFIAFSDENDAFTFIKEGAKNEYASPPNYEKALEYYIKAKQFLTEPHYISYNMLVISNCYYKLSQYEESIAYAKKALKNEKKNSVHTYYEFIAQYYIFRVLKKQKKKRAWDVLTQLLYLLEEKKYTFNGMQQYLFWRNKLLKIAFENRQKLSQRQKERVKYFQKLIEIKKAREQFVTLLYQKLQYSISDGIVSKDIQFYFTYYNNKSFLIAYKSMRKQNKKYIVGISLKIKKLEDIVSPLLKEENTLKFQLSLSLQQNKNKAFIQKRVFGLEHWIFSANLISHNELSKIIQREIILSLSLTLILSIILFSGFYIAIKVFRKEKELSDMKSNFVACISHELRTPLALIQSYTETLLMGRASESKKQKYYTIIFKETEHLGRLIKSILNISKIEEGKLNFSFESASLYSLLEKLEKEANEYWPKSGKNITLELDSVRPYAFIDKSAIHSALFNLLDNAMKYGKNEIILRAFCRDEYICIEVEDDGIGIEKREHKRIFETFYRAKSPKNITGIGLGLTMVKYIIEGHEGKIEIRSEKDKGSIFTLFIPWRKNGKNKNFGY